jgi:hypothetical protein
VLEDAAWRSGAALWRCDEVEGRGAVAVRHGGGAQQWVCGPAATRRGGGAVATQREGGVGDWARQRRDEDALRAELAPCQPPSRAVATPTPPARPRRPPPPPPQSALGLLLPPPGSGCQRRWQWPTHLQRRGSRSSSASWRPQRSSTQFAARRLLAAASSTQSCSIFTSLPTPLWLAAVVGQRDLALLLRLPPFLLPCALRRM